jgi:tetratricopeptide (TPR) repeat protein
VGALSRGRRCLRRRARATGRPGVRVRSGRAAATPPGAATLIETTKREPALADYALYFRARRCHRRPAGRCDRPRARARTSHADSVWVASAALLEGDGLRRGGDLAAARAAFATARAAFPPSSPWWPRAALSGAEVAAQLGDVEDALALAHDVRRAAPRGIAGRRARRLSERLRRARPDLPLDHVDEAELRLRAGDLGGARDETEAALGPELAPALEARALCRAQAERGLDRGGRRGDLSHARESRPSDPLAPRALVAAAGWRERRRRPGGSSPLPEVLRRFPDRLQAADALYGMGRIAQEEARYEEARRSYTRLAEQFPDAEPPARHAGERPGCAT